MSLHKVGLAPCQIACVLFNNEELARAYDEVAKIGFATTSPNQLMLATAEARFSNLIEGQALADWDATINACRDFVGRVGEIHSSLEAVDMRSLGATRWNPNQAILYTGKIPVDARIWAQELSSQFARDVEMASANVLNLLFSPGNHNDVDELIADLKASLTSALEKSKNTAVNGTTFQSCVSDGAAINPRKAFFSKTKLVALDDAIGETASSLGVITPPCKKIWGYGDKITPELISDLKQAVERNFPIQGLESLKGVPAIRIVDRDTSFKIRTIKTPIIDDELAEEAAYFLTGGWAAAPYFHAFIDGNTGEYLSPAAYQNRIYETDTFKNHDWYTWKELSDISLKPGYHRAVDVEKYKNVLIDRFQDSGYITIVRDVQGNLMGLLHCRCGVTIERLANTEEWLFAHMMCSTLETSEAGRDHLYEKLRYHFNLSPKHKVNSIGAQILHPSVQGGDVFRAMMRDVGETISPSHSRLSLLCELSDEGSTARTVNEAVMDRIVYDVLPPENGHCIGYSSRTSNSLYYYQVDKKHWTHAVREQALKESRSYFPHPEDHPNLEVRETEDGRGLGVFATGTGIKAGEIVARFDGELYRSENATALHPVMVDHAIQVSEFEYCYGRFGLAQCINSSHSPNLALLDNTALVALVDIPAGTEVVWMYEMSEVSDWKFEPCLCQSEHCPGWIGSFFDLSQNRQRQLIASGHAADWVCQKYG